MQRADAEIKAVEHRVAGEQHADEDEPDGVEVEIHGINLFVFMGEFVPAKPVCRTESDLRRAGRAGFCR